MSIAITSPANSGVPFPNTIDGTYDNFPGTPPVAVEFVNQSTGKRFVSPPTVTPGSGGAGTWILAKPSGVLPGVLYTIIAVLGADTDTRINIQN